ncbi:MAG: electron transport complex subunit E [Desulfofustis sp. PB-SRB1]|nr:electron transport complex subunit E [Desulfofustis sp. PB-SRB1]MBM1003367.1 electron transport complex subunit E [Desulfofustis sp. PB-SRB1]HBH28447.1 electron transport complex subunit RsxE [Desulfofustis sp.]HBH32767.1 electron transport complex subunit RsxE [Desulfofustis sp.]
MAQLYLDTLTGGLWKRIPPFRLVLGLCPALAVTMSAENGLGMGVATACVIILSNGVISALRNLIPHKVRIASYIAIIATLVSIVEIVMKAFFFPLSQQLGIYIPLIVVNCIVLGRAEGFAAKNPPLLAMVDGLSIGIGYGLSLTLIGSIREILGAGTWFGLPLFGESFEPMSFFVSAPGAFVTIGILLAVQNLYSRRRGEKFIQG